MLRKLVYCILAVSLGIGIFETVDTGKVEAAAPVLATGDHGGYVWGLQNRLQQLGLYTNHVDGIFGPLTRLSVIKFQRRNGLAVDGIVGQQTWHSLRQQTFTKKQIQLLAQLVYAEARGESLKGQVGVAAVVLNRIDSNKFPDTLKGVLYAPHAFTCIQNGTFYNHPDKEAYKAVYLAIQGWDPTDGSYFYFNPAKATSGWIWSRPQTVTIGHHIFAK